ncbi:MAG: protein phosphatase 2C domain-containing protein [Gemmataceae bacterium]|nr:protein phosphatase 2C domain-containing protein [Gemmataceae bacterium]
MPPADAPDPGGTDEIPIQPSALPAVAESLSSRFHVDYGAVAHQGLVRTHNEDRYWFARFGRSLHTLLTNLPEQRLPRRLDEIGYAMLVADGMGGASAGEFASELAVLTLVSLVLDTPDWILSTEEPMAERVLERMAERFQHIDQVLHERGAIDSALAGMGTTMTLAASLGPRLVIAHVGDSRAYLLRGADLTRLTKDHTMAQHLVDRGVFERVDQVNQRLQHALDRCLGGRGGASTPDVEQMLLADGDQFLLCTDGLTNMVDDAGIARILVACGTARAASQALVDAALANGGRDNVTVVVARYRSLSP